jgi:hypothetical protein
MTHDSTFWFQVLRDLARRPRLWHTAVRQFVRMIPHRWWRRPPFLPLPDPAYVRYRIETAYGPRGRPEATDVITYLDWCRAGVRGSAGR